MFDRIPEGLVWAIMFLPLGSFAVITLVSFLGLPINQFPQVNIPVVTVTTTYPGANPQAIETQITRPIEDALAGLSNVEAVSAVAKKLGM